MKYPKQSIVFGAIFLGGAIYALFFKKDYRIKLRQKSTQIVVGQVTKVHRGILDYTYNYEGGQHAGGRNVREVIYSPQRFVNKFFPVVVSKEDADESAILITPNEFVFFNKAFPDSLEWVVEWVVWK